MKRWYKKFRDETGQGLVEIALILPVFLLLVLGMFDLGWLLNAHFATDSAAREIARTVVVSKAGENKETIAANLGGTLLNSGQFKNKKISVNPKEPKSGDKVTITIETDFSPLVGLVVSKDTKIKSSTTMRME